METLTLTDRITEAVRLTGQRGSRYLPRAPGQLISHSIDDVRLCVLVPPGYMQEQVRAAVDYLHQRGLEAQFSCLSWFERTFLNKPYIAGDNPANLSRAANEWKIVVKPFRINKAGMPRGPRARRRYEVWCV